MTFAASSPRETDGVNKTTGSDLIVEMLALHGVEHIFGFPGDSTLPIYASVKRHGRIQHVVARCQKCAAYMADAYARVTGKPGVCDAPGGIGSTLLPPALNEARNSSVPLVTVTARTSRGDEGKWSTSQCDQRAMLGALVKETITVEDASRIPEHLRNAFLAATSPRMGPVHLEIPADMLVDDVEVPSTEMQALARCQVYPSVRSLPDESDLVKLLDLLLTSKRPIVYAGGGVLAAGGEDALETFCRNWSLPVCTTVSGKGTVAEASFALSIGVAGAKGHPAVNHILRDADLIVLVGTKLGDKATSSWTLLPTTAVLVHIDSDPRELGRNVIPSLALLGDAQLVFRELNRLTQQRGVFVGESAIENEWLARVQQVREEVSSFALRSPAPTSSSPITAADVIAAMNALLPKNTIVATDAGPSSGWVGSLYLTKDRGRRVIASRGSGSLGFGLPAAIGAKIGKPECTVVGIGGDAGFAMASHELEVAVRYALPLTYIVLNNQTMGMMDQAARDLYGLPDLFSAFAPVRWASVAAAYGCESRQVFSMGELQASLAEIDRLKGPLLLEVMVSLEQVTHDAMLTDSNSAVLHNRSTS